MKITPIILAVSAVAGVFMTSQFGTTAAGIVILIMLAAFFVYARVSGKLDLGILAITAIFLLSSVAYTLSVSAYVHKSINYINRYVTIKGTVVGSGDKSQSSDSYRYVLRVREISNIYGKEKTNEDIILTTPNKYCVGESLKIKGIIKDLPKQMNESGFDAAKYYRSRNIFARIHSENIESIAAIPVFSLYAIGEYVGECVDKVIYRYYKGDGAAILSAVLTGNKHHFSEEYKSVLDRTTLHRVFHPAHLHIWIILSIIGIASSLIRKQYRDILAAAVFIIYAVLQCSNIGFARCLVCAAVTIYYRIRYGKAYFPDTVSVVIIFCCITMPTILFNNSFILSVAGGLIGWEFIPIFSKKLRKLPKRTRRTASAMLAFLLILSPIVAYFYSGLCIYSFLAPFITAYLVVGIIALAPLSLLMELTFGSAPIIGAYLNFAVRMLYKLPYLVDSLPFSSINIGRPLLAFELMFICLIFATYYKIKRKKTYRYAFLSGAAGFFGVAVIISAMRIGTAELAFVNVGQGDGSIIHVPYKETVVIDAGGSSEYSDYNTGEALFLPYLGAKGINHIEAVVVSHYHKDHAEGIMNVINSIRTDYVFIPEITEADSNSMVELSANIRRVAQMRGTKVCFVTEDTRLEFDSGLTLDIFAPDEALRKNDENDTSLIVRASYGDFSALYTGDITSRSEKELIKRADVASDVLKIAHHGSRDSSCDEFISAVAPELAVISCGVDNVYNHPHTEVLDRLRDTSVLRTDIMGDIRISARKSGKYAVN